MTDRTTLVPPEPDTLPAPTMVEVKMLIDVELYLRLEEQAELIDVTVNGLILRSLMKEFG